MKKSISASPTNRSLAEDQYGEWLTRLKAGIRASQVRAVFAVNAELIQLYWKIGKEIREREANEGWGSGIIPRLSSDLRTEFPGVKGFSKRNLAHMRAFAEAWPHDVILQTLSAKLPWSHHTVLLEKLKSADERIWYANMAVKNGWSVRVLSHQIDTNLRSRSNQSMNNFPATLPAPHSDLVRDVFKDQYVFDFVELRAEAHERHLESKLIDKIKNFLLELGVGFAFVGNQYRMEVAGKEFYIDLLFYHTRLHRYVVVDLKMEAFAPEFAGKMNFYVNLVDKQLCTHGDQPTVGLLLCRERDRLIVDYSLGGIQSPIAVSGYTPGVVPALPPDVANYLPSAEALSVEVEAMIEAEIEDAQT